MDYSGTGLNELLSGIAPTPPQNKVRPERVIPEPKVINDCLTVRYGDQELERRLYSAGKLKTLTINGIPVGIRLTQGVDQRGFYFYFDDGSSDFRRYYHPKGLREIRINSQFINVDIERKWLIEAYVARYNRSLGSFMSVNHSSNSGALLSYFCTLSQMTESKLDFLLLVLNKAVNESNDPYFRLYLFDVVMSRVMRSLIVRRFKTRLVTIDQSETISVVEAAVDLLHTVISDSKDNLRNLTQTFDPDQFMPISSATIRSNPNAFWSGAYYQAERRRQLLLEAMQNFYCDTVLELLPESELMVCLKEENAVIPVTSDPEAEMEFHIQKVIKQPEARAVNWTAAN
jgi:hypothetical protein